LIASGSLYLHLGSEPIEIGGFIFIIKIRKGKVEGSLWAGIDHPLHQQRKRQSAVRRTAFRYGYGNQ
jgi:hypothetical protein